jgi:predicted AlkP superfamily pyrophosphatase or phosphodiesterase
VGRQPDPARRQVLWAESPLVDEYLVSLVEDALRTEQLGQRDATDMLAMSFSTLDLVGHAFGPESHEVQDTLARIDRGIGRILDALDARVGRDRYVVALSADHGVSPIPEQARRAGLPSGRVAAGDISKAIEGVLAGRFGPGKYVSRVTYTDIYLAPGVEARLAADPAAWRELRTALRAIPGIDRAFSIEELTSPLATDDPALRAARLSYYPGRSGDIVLTPRPYWILSAAATTHGSLHGYDAHVPLLLFGAGIKPGRYWQAATPADIAPTLAALAGITMARAEGRVLSEAFQPSPPE